MGPGFADKFREIFHSHKHGRKQKRPVWILVFATGCKTRRDAGKLMIDALGSFRVSGVRPRDFTWFSISINLAPQANNLAEAESGSVRRRVKASPIRTACEFPCRILQLPYPSQDVNLDSTNGPPKIAGRVLSVQEQTSQGWSPYMRRISKAFSVTSRGLAGTAFDATRNATSFSQTPPGQSLDVRAVLGSSHPW